MKLLGDREVAALMGISVSRLRMRISAGEPMPPYILLPNSKFRRWIEEDVLEWMRKYQRGGDTAPRATSSRPNPGQRKGRPTKAETLARRARAIQEATRSDGA